MKLSMSYTLMLTGLLASSVWAATEGDSLATLAFPTNLPSLNNNELKALKNTDWVKQTPQWQQTVSERNAAALNLRSALQAYQNNQLPLSGLLQAEQQWLEVRQSQIQDASAEQMAYADIEALTGKAL